MKPWRDTQGECDRKETTWRALEAARWNQAEAAFLLQMPREGLNRQLRTWGGPSQFKKRHKHHRITCEACSQQGIEIGAPGDGVTLSASPEGTSLTSGESAPILSGMPETLQMPEKATARIPPVTVPFDAEEDFFVSAEIAQNRLAGGPKTRSGVVRAALRFFMASKSKPKAARRARTEGEDGGGGERE